MYTIQKNSLGHLHIWKDDVQPQRTGAYNYTAGGKESDLYVQVEQEIEAIIMNLTIGQLRKLTGGLPIKTENLDL